MCRRGVLAVIAFSLMRRMWHLMGVRGVPGGMSMLRVARTVTLGSLERRPHTMMKRKRNVK
jgi:hypothetical protein